MDLAYKLKEATAAKLQLSDGMRQANFDISELWSCLLEMLMIAFPKSRAEALHMSSESTIIQRPTSFEFSKDSFFTKDETQWMKELYLRISINLEE